MKTITNYINESRVKFSVKLVNNSRSPFRKFIYDVVNDWIEEIKNDPIDNEFPLDDDPVETGNKIYDALINIISTSPELYNYHIEPQNVESSIIKDAGITPKSLFDSFNTWIKSNRGINKNIKRTFGIGVNLSKEISENTRNKYKDKIKNYGINPSQINEETAEKEYKSGDKIVWAVRTKDGDKDVVFYTTPSDVDKYDARHVVRYIYAYDMNYNYYLTRECLYESWLKMDEEHKYAAKK